MAVVPFRRLYWLDTVLLGEDPQAAVDAAQASGLGEPAGVAKLLAFLVSDDADYVRG